MLTRRITYRSARGVNHGKALKANTLSRRHTRTKVTYGVFANRITVRIRYGMIPFVAQTFIRSNAISIKTLRITNWFTGVGYICMLISFIALAFIRSYAFTRDTLGITNRGTGCRTNGRVSREASARIGSSAMGILTKRITYWCAFAGGLIHYISFIALTASRRCALTIDALRIVTNRSALSFWGLFISLVTEALVGSDTRSIRTIITDRLTGSFR